MTGPGSPRAAPMPAPEMSRPLRLDRLPRGAPHAFAEEASAEERAAIARLFGAISVDRFRFDGRLLPSGPEGWTLEARLRATIVQRCVVSLQPVAQKIDEPVRRRYLPGAEGAIDIDPVEEDETEPLPSRLDLGAVAIEAAALALDPWPRHPDASLPEPAADATPAPSPFAGLAALKREGDGEAG